MGLAHNPSSPESHCTPIVDTENTPMIPILAKLSKIKNSTNVLSGDVMMKSVQKGSEANISFFL